MNILVREDGLAEKERDYRRIGRLSIAYIMAIIGEVMRTRQTDFLDILIVTAVFNANGEEKRGVSRNALKRMLNIPLETVRRHVNALVARKALIEGEDGLVFSYGNDIGLGNNAALDELNFRQLCHLFHALKEQGVDFEQEPVTEPVDEEPGAGA